ncbi:MAG TPA: site-specific integrase [Candidatus Acidoferrum sp.]|nr:site-specific integrase [Candidatus Acidoferrum sp.]
MRRKPKAKLYLRFRTPDGKQSPYCPALFDHKSRIRPFWCLVKGVEELHRDGTYYRRAKRDGKWKWESLGNDAHAAYAKLDVPPVIPVKPAGKNEVAAPTVKDGFRIDEEIAVYLSNVSKLAPKTYKVYTRSLELFRQSCKKIYVHQITKQDLQAFDTALIEKGDEDRTRHNRVQNVVTFLRNEEGRRPGPPIKDVSIKVKYVEAPPEAYTRLELEDLFRVSDEDEKFLWRFFLGTGFRESEVSVAEITDVNRDTKTIRVDEKPYFGFKPKDCEKRNVPIPDALISEIDARTKSGSCSLLFGNNGRPDGHLLRLLKQVAFGGGLNCRKCKGTVNGKEVSCAEAPVCEKWILHRFRKNFATDRHNGGAPARKIQKWLGHADLETTLRYLAVGEDTSEEVRNIVNGVHVGL